MKKLEKLKLEISGKTDNTGTNAHNLELSENRTKALVNYLVQHGISQDRLNYKGYGSSKPVEDNSNEPGRSKNRRVEITIIDK